jgi:hypothetical protein
MRFHLSSVQDSVRRPWRSVIRKTRGSGVTDENEESPSRRGTRDRNRSTDRRVLGGHEGATDDASVDSIPSRSSCWPGSRASRVGFARARQRVAQFVAPDSGCPSCGIMPSKASRQRPPIRRPDRYYGPSDLVWIGVSSFKGLRNGATAWWRYGWSARCAIASAQTALRKRFSAPNARLAKPSWSICQSRDPRALRPAKNLALPPFAGP